MNWGQASPQVGPSIPLYGAEYPSHREAEKQLGRASRKSFNVITLTMRYSINIKRGKRH